MIVVGYYVHVTVHSSVFLFPNDNFSKYKWTFTKSGMCIDIVEICFEIANGHSC